LSGSIQGTESQKGHDEDWKQCLFKGLNPARECHDQAKIISNLLKIHT
jgi:hypothetical protein